MTAVTLKEKAYAELRRCILNGELKPGDVLTERILTDMLAMSRTPIRAALERLDSEGLAKYSPNKGLVVTEYTLEQVIDFFDLRLALECHIVQKLAGRTLDDAHRRWLDDNLAEQAGCVHNRDIVAFSAADSAFHLYLARIHGNTEIIQTMERLQDKLHLVGLRVLRKDANRIRQSWQDHARIYELLVSGDSEQAARIMADHLEYGKRILVL